jgi:hypothetical protein
MAIYKLQVGVTQPIGSMGGATFQVCGRNKSIRARRCPVQKRSPRQTQSRNRLEHVSTNFRNLSGVQKGTFATESSNYPRTDSQGNTYLLKSNNLFNSSNVNLGNAALSEINSMPSFVSPPAITENVFIISQILLSGAFTITPNIVPTNFTLFAYYTRPISGGILSPGEPFVLLYNLQQGSASNALNIYPVYKAQFGVFQNPGDLWVHAKVQIISNLTGQVLVTLTDRSNFG